MEYMHKRKPKDYHLDETQFLLSVDCAPLAYGPSHHILNLTEVLRSYLE